MVDRFHREDNDDSEGQKKDLSIIEERKSEAEDSSFVESTQSHQKRSVVAQDLGSWRSHRGMLSDLNPENEKCP